MPTLDEVLSHHLEDEQLEELVCVYLQNRFGYLVRGDYLLCHPERAVATVQVRSRPPRLPTTRAVERVYAFPPNDGPPRPNVVELDYEDFVAFVASERWSLPLGVAQWVSWALDDERMAATA
jgi:hypothetical protein